MRTYQWDDRYCPKGHKWVFMASSTLFPDCYYCETCDEIYEPAIRKISKKWFQENFSTPRFEQIKQKALYIDALEKVTREDLQKLGYLNQNAPK